VQAATRVRAAIKGCGLNFHDRDRSKQSPFFGALFYFKSLSKGGWWISRKQSSLDTDVVGQAQIAQDPAFGSGFLNFGSGSRKKDASGSAALFPIMYQ